MRCFVAYTKHMKRLFACLVGAVIALSIASSTAWAGVNDFTISRFEADYYLSKDNGNRSTLKTVEKITAEFPQFDQNHGLERAIPQSYDGHSTHVDILSVVDQTGAILNYSTSISNDNLVLRIGDADTYVHGSQTYVITYQQRDVTRFFADTKSDEFYWDTNGTQWAVPIQNLTVRLHVADKLAGSLTGTSACYVGSFGSTDLCQLTKNGTTFQATATQLLPYQNLTIAVGFNPNTFAAYQPSFLERVASFYGTLLVLTSLVTPIIIIWLGIRWSRWSNRKKELGTIVPEYLPPKDTSVTTSSSIVSIPLGVFTAQLLDFAVRHYIKIYETKPKKGWSKAQYDIEIIRDITDLLPEEQELFKDIFGNTAVGQRLSLKSLQNNTTVYTRMSNNDKKLKKLVRGDYGLRTKSEQKSAWFKKTGWILLVLSIIMLSPGLFIAALFAFLCAYTLWPLTDKGLALRRYLDGLKMYIKVAETDRLKMLQSPEGAQKVKVSADDPAQLVKLYERVLPYAVLFGEEKEWNKQIGSYYESAGTSPDWYSGNAVFNAAVFSSAMSSFSSSASYTSASSSSSGGSSGGGSSGGGGGGGGGGGW
ncbi:MAG: hypothetical protein JWM00_806 [Candidatus Saccharibacteria bacterium]|nr:hypothetical protein [Candidatus Saccharibacteria bacterium]